MSKYSLARAPIAAGESKKEYDQVYAMVVRDYEPCSAYELFLVTRMVNLHWRILRLEHNEADKISMERLLLRAGRPIPRKVNEEIASMKLEFGMYKLLDEIRKEFQSVRVRREALAMQRNENAYPIMPKVIELNLLPSGLAKKAK